MRTTKQKAEQFQQMHHDANLLILGNAWNGGSAKIFAKAGFAAVGTTSAGIAYAKGVPDGEYITFATLLDVVQEMHNAVDVPISVDFERGYADDVAGVVNNMRQLVAAGAVGCNIEDGIAETNQLDDISLQCEKIQALAELKKELDVPFVINARTCGVWLKLYDENQLDTVIERCNAFIEAGADCAFIPGILGQAAIAYLNQHIHAPINIIANPKITIAELKALNVARLSLGSAPVRSVLAKEIAVAQRIAQDENLSELFTHDFSYAAANRYFA